MEGPTHFRGARSIGCLWSVICVHPSSESVPPYITPASAVHFGAASAEFMQLTEIAS